MYINQHVSNRVLLIVFLSESNKNLAYTKHSIENNSIRNV